MAKRKAVALVWGAKRRRTGGRRRRVFGRKFKTFDKFTASSSVNRGGIRYGKKPRFNPRKWRLNMWKASETQQKYRSNNAITAALTSAATQQQGNVHVFAMVQDAGGGSRFWQPAGGLVTGNEVPATVDFGGSDLFVRGGSNRILFTNNNATLTLRVITWRGHISKNGAVPVNPFVASQGWDPSLPNPALLATDPERDVWKNYKFWGAQDVILKPNESFERSERIPTHKIDQDQWVNNRSRNFWFVFIQNTNTAVAAPLQVTTSWNLAFTGDRVI